MTTLENAIERFENNAEFERRNYNLQGCLEFRQFAEWLKDYKRLLEQEPCDDAVSRQAVKEALRNRIGESISECINAIPPVRPQEQTGHWILTIEDWNKWTCSECGYYERTDIHVSLGWKFCPNCGAKMQESEG